VKRTSDTPIGTCDGIVGIFILCVAYSA